MYKVCYKSNNNHEWAVVHAITVCQVQGLDRLEDSLTMEQSAYMNRASDVVSDPIRETQHTLCRNTYACLE